MIRQGAFSYGFAYDANGNITSLISFTMGGKDYFYIRNAQSDVIGLADEAGNVVVNYQYDSWGKVTGITGSLAATVGKKNPFRYRGYYHDEETGMYYLQSRYYGPEIKRFINADRCVTNSLLGTNLYAYCENNPVNMMDPDGNFAWALFLGGYGAAEALKWAAAGILAIAGTVAVSKVSKNICVPTGKTSWGNSGSIYNPGATREWYTGKLKEKIDKSFSKVRAIPWYEGQAQRHHIVAQSSQKAKKTRNLLHSVGLNTGIKENIVTLKRGFHQRLHNSIYYKWIHYEIEQVQPSGDQAVKDKLENLGYILKGMSDLAPF